MRCACEEREGKVWSPCGAHVLWAREWNAPVPPPLFDIDAGVPPLRKIARESLAAEELMEVSRWRYFQKIHEQLREIRWQQFILLWHIFRLDPSTFDPEGGGANSPKFPPTPEDFK